MHSFWSKISDLGIKYQSNSSHESCVGGFEKEIAGKVFPLTTQEVKKIVSFANETGTLLYPISSGKNWGMGSHLPVKDGSVIVDLSGMKRISNFSNQFGVVTIEAGVTQKQLSDYLTEVNSDWFVDVTGSASSTSIIGNALERGMGYNTLRVETTGPIEVVLGTGEVYRTGFLPHSEAITPHLYKYGIGPSMDGLFFQSNFGIVTSATISLQKKSEVLYPFILRIGNTADMAAVVDSLRGLIQDQTLRCVPHIFNQYRLHPGILSLLHFYFVESKDIRTKIELERIVASEFPTEWVCVGNVKGSKKEVKAHVNKLRKILGHHGKLIVVTPALRKFASWLSIFSFMKNKIAILKAQEPLKDLVSGTPTDMTLSSIQWPVRGPSVTIEECMNPDQSHAGVLFTSPVAPLSGHWAQISCNIATEISLKFGFRPAITINCLNMRLMEAVISLHFDRRDRSKVQAAQQCISEMQSEMVRAGVLPYRLSIGTMNQYQSEEMIVLSQFKKILDPNNIISPLRYSIQ